VGLIITLYWLIETSRKLKLESTPASQLTTHEPKPALRPKKPHIQSVLDTVTWRKKRPKQATDHSPPSNVKVKNKWRYNSPLPYAYVLCIWTTLTIKQHKTMCLFSVNSKVFGSFCHLCLHVLSQPVYRCCSTTQHENGHLSMHVPCTTDNR
jgi:hypothetical protein